MIGVRNVGEQPVRVLEHGEDRKTEALILPGELAWFTRVEIPWEVVIVARRPREVDVKARTAQA